MSYVNKSLQKKDAMALVTGKPVYTDDLAPKDCLIIKILRSPYALSLIHISPPAGAAITANTSVKTSINAMSRTFHLAILAMIA